jgi:hypothetical protein
VREREREREREEKRKEEIILEAMKKRDCVV